MLEIAIAKSKIPPSVTELNSLPSQCKFIVFLTILKDTLPVTRLVKKLKHWFKEGQKSLSVTGSLEKKQKFAFVIQCLIDQKFPRK